MTAEMDRLRKEVLASGELVNKVRTGVAQAYRRARRRCGASLQRRRTQWVYLWVSKLMMVAASIGITLGLSIGS